MFFSEILYIRRSIGTIVQMRRPGFDIPLNHIVLVAVFLRGDSDHFTELLYKMALGGKRKPVCYFYHRIIAEPE